LKLELALFADDRALIATSRMPTLLVSYLEICVSNLERWLRDREIAIKPLEEHHDFLLED
jgi:hypothetical protein